MRETECVDYEIELSEGTMEEGREASCPEGMEKMFRYSMEKDDDGNVIIRPMNGENKITIHGEDDAKFFTDLILDHYRTT